MICQLTFCAVLTNRAPKPQMENRMTTEPQPTVLNPIAVSNQEPEATPIQQQPSSIASIPMSSIILDPPEKPVVNPNNSLFTTGNQPQVKTKISTHFNHKNKIQINDPCLLCSNQSVQALP